MALLLFTLILCVAVPPSISDPYAYYPLDISYKTSEEKNAFPPLDIPEADFISGPGGCPQSAIVLHGNETVMIDNTNRTLTFTNVMSFFLYMNPSSSAYIMAYGFRRSLRLYLRMINMDSLRFQFNGNRNSRLNARNVLPQEQWNHVGFTFSTAGVLRIWVNGESVSNKSVPHLLADRTATNIIYIGSSPRRIERLSGGIACMAFYDREVDEKEIRALMNKCQMCKKGSDIGCINKTYCKCVSTSCASSQLPYCSSTICINCHPDKCCCVCPQQNTTSVYQSSCWINESCQCLPNRLTCGEKGYSHCYPHRCNGECYGESCCCVYTESIYTKMMQKMADPYNKKFTWDIKLKMMGRKEHEAARIFIDELGIPITVDEYLSQLKALMVEFFPLSEVMPGADRLVRHLYKHNVPMALATGSDSHFFSVKTKNHQDLFCLFGHSVFSSEDPEVHHGKPAPDCFLVANDRFGTPPKTENVLVFEDAPNGVQAALSAGMKVIWVPDPNVNTSVININPTETLKSLTEFVPEKYGLPAYEL